MYLVAIAWIYVVLMMAIAEATSTQGTVLGALVTFVLYGALPISIVLYVMGAPGRARARKAAEAAEQAAAAPQDTPAPSPADTPDGRGHAAGDAVPPERKET